MEEVHLKALFKTDFLLHRKHTVACIIRGVKFKQDHWQFPVGGHERATKTAAKV
jgi:hypothetical protein